MMCIVHPIYDIIHILLMLQKDGICNTESQIPETNQTY